MSTATGTMPSSRRTTIYLGPEDYKVFKRDNAQDSKYNNTQNESSTAGKGHDKLLHEGEEVCKGRAAIEAFFEKMFAKFAACYEKLSGKIKATFNKQRGMSASNKEPTQTDKEAI